DVDGAPARLRREHAPVRDHPRLGAHEFADRAGLAGERCDVEHDDQREPAADAREHALDIVPAELVQHPRVRDAADQHHAHVEDVTDEVSLALRARHHFDAAGAGPGLASGSSSRTSVTVHVPPSRRAMRPSRKAIATRRCASTTIPATEPGRSIGTVSRSTLPRFTVTSSSVVSCSDTPTRSLPIVVASTTWTPAGHAIAIIVFRSNAPRSRSAHRSLTSARTSLGPFAIGL